jgi:signal transduction histidine kinase/CheY-like chemotaxis protein
MGAIAGRLGKCLALVAALALPVPLAVAAPQQANGVWSIDEARFVPGAAPLPGPDAGRTQSLPHVWKSTDPQLTGDAWYVMRLRLAAEPVGLQAVYLQGITVPAELWLNGVRIGATGPLDGRRPRSYEQSQYIPLSEGELRAGDNELLVHVRAATASVAALAPVRVGVAATLRREATRDLVVHTLGPAAVAVVNVTVGLSLLALWLRRRDPSYVALFGVATILWGLHTGVSLLPEPPIPNPHYGIWWHGVYMLFVALLCLFSVRFAQCNWPRYERLAMGYALLVVPVLYAALAVGIAGPASDAIRLGGIALVAWALVGVARYVRDNRGTDSRLLLLTGIVSVAFAIHDWLAAISGTNVRPVWLVPYAALAFLVLVGWILVDRFVRALNDAELVNAGLESAVAEKSAALVAQLAETRAAKDAAETANVAKSRFLAAASHDLRQPLHAIGLFASALAEHARGPDERALVQRISRSVDSLETYFASLLDVSRLDAGAMVAEVSDLPANELLDRVAHDFAPVALERGLSLAVVPSRVYLRTDPTLIERILRNLVANALRYTTAGGVVVGCRRRGGAIALEVWDSGPGIAARERTRIFDEFYRGEAAVDADQRGLGLGLSIVARLAALLSHRVDFDSSEGRGSVFRVLLPRGDGTLSPPASADPAAGGSLAGHSIVVVDDEAPVREGMQKLLETWGCRTFVAADADGALIALGDGGRPDALIVDYRLAAGRDGLEAIAAVRAVHGNVPALLVSGESHPVQLARIRASGLMVLHKPVPAARLRSALAHLLQRRGSANR